MSQAPIWVVHHDGKRTHIRAHDWEADDTGVNFLSTPGEDRSCEIIAFFSHPVRLWRIDVEEG